MHRSEYPRRGIAARGENEGARRKAPYLLTVEWALKKWTGSCAVITGVPFGAGLRVSGPKSAISKH